METVKLLCRGDVSHGVEEPPENITFSPVQGEG